MSDVELTIIHNMGEIFEGGAKRNQLRTTQIVHDSWDGTPAQCIICNCAIGFPKCIIDCSSFTEDERKKYADEIGLTIPKVHRIEDLPGKSVYYGKAE